MKRKMAKAQNQTLFSEWLKLTKLPGGILLRIWLSYFVEERGEVDRGTLKVVNIAEFGQDRIEPLDLKVEFLTLLPRCGEGMNSYLNQ